MFQFEIDFSGWYDKKAEKTDMAKKVGRSEFLDKTGELTTNLNQNVQVTITLVN